MCGIVGYFGQLAASNGHLDQACTVLGHRGPDDRGVWVDEEASVGLAHARLAILDLSPAGHQPMVSRCGRYVIVFNGEIYNHLELRDQLGDDAGWRGHSDTETLLACISAWGCEQTLRALVGMFAFGLWDRVERKLSVARDRMGEKPLYYGYAGNCFVFASELKGLAAFPGLDRRIDRTALSMFMRHNCVSGRHSIFAGVSKLLPGTWLSVSEREVRSRAGLEPNVYWSAMEHVRLGVREPMQFGSDRAAIDELDRVLRRSVAGQMVADVPLGAFLSGGIDSSTVVSLMQAQSSRPVKTFSIGFDVRGYDEAAHARSVARHLGTDHTELYVSAKDALAVIPRLPSIYDEPFADSSQVPTFLIAQLARQHVRVSLSGDGGDELFGGYNRYFLGARAWRYLQHIPRALRSLVAKTILLPSPTFWDGLYGLLGPLLPFGRRLTAPGEAVQKGAQWLDASSGIMLYRGLVSHWEPEELVIGDSVSNARFSEDDPALPTLAESMMALDAVTYLPDDILVKVDRAAMAVSLETRVPMLDHRVFEFAWKLPLHYKLRRGIGKWLLREVLYGYVPRELVERPKMGFGVPIHSWLRGPLRSWAEELLDERRLKNDGYLNPAPIRRKWAEHLSGRRNWQYYLWDVLMFQAWLEHQR